MGRNKKTGLDYFPFDTDTFQDIKIRKLIKRQGGKAVTVYALLLCIIYKDGYYTRWDEELPFIISEQTGFEEAYISQVITVCLSLGLFSKELFDTEGILTSRGIQERYRDICRQIKRKCAFDHYSLISSGETGISSEEIGISSEEKPINSVEIPQNKIKGNKREEKEKKISSPQSPPGGGGGGQDFLSSSLSQRDGMPRNLEGLCQAMQRLGIPQSQQDEIMRLSNYGQIGHPVWQHLARCRDSQGARLEKDRIRLPGSYILKQLRQAPAMPPAGKEAPDD